MISTFASLGLLLGSPAFDLSVGGGAESNPYEMPADPAVADADFGPRSGAFLAIDGRLRWRTRSGRVVRVGLDASVDCDLFGWVAVPQAGVAAPHASHLDRADGEVSLPLVLDPMPYGRAFRLDLTIEPRAAFDRLTYTSHRTGRPIVIDAADDPGNDPPIPVSLADRYDKNALGLLAEMDASFGRSVDVVVGGRITRVDYVEDYEEFERVDSWDHVEYRGDADLYVTAGSWLIASGYSARLLEYDERFPHAADGSDVLPDEDGYEPQRLSLHHLSAKVGRIGNRGRAVLRWRGTRRLDLSSGYLDYTEHRVSADVRIGSGDGVELRLSPSWSERVYDELRVRYDPDEPIASRRRFVGEATLEWGAFTSRTRLFVTAAAEAQRSSNPLYTYSSVRGLMGVRVVVD